MGRVSVGVAEAAEAAGVVVDVAVVAEVRANDLVKSSHKQVSVYGLIGSCSTSDVGLLHHEYALSGIA